jgi:hypothetical protein
MIWSGKPSPQSTRDPEIQPEPTAASVQSMPPVNVPARRGEAIAILGLPDSGKTSFLFALKAAPERTAGLRWSWPPSSIELARMTGRAGELLPATAAHWFSTSRLLTLHRKWMKGAASFVPGFLCPTRRITICEVSGENVRDFADGIVPPGEARQAVLAKFERYLSVCDEVLFLTALRNSYQSGTLSQDSIETSMKEAVDRLSRIIGSIRESAGARSTPLFVNFLVTKRDALKDIPGLDSVRIPESQSAVARLASRNPLATTIYSRDEDGCVVFSVNRAGDEAGADLELQEAIAVDFLACHAPKAAGALAGLAAQGGVSLRVLTVNPFGCECKNSAGQNALPAPGQLNSSMVWESLDDVVERSFRWRARVRLRRAGIAAVVLLALIAVLCPGGAYYARSSADSAIAAGNDTAARVALGADGWNPWSMLERGVSQAHQRADAQRWNRLREVVAKHHPDSEELEELDKEVAKRDPDGSLATNAMRMRNLRRMVEFVEMRIDDRDLRELTVTLKTPAHLRLTSAESEDLLRAVHLLRGAGPFLRIKTANDWRQVESRLKTVISWVGTGKDRDKEALVLYEDQSEDIDRFRQEVERSAKAAALRAQLVDVVSRDGGVADWKVLQQLGEQAAEVQDHQSAVTIATLVSSAVQRAWNAECAPPAPHQAPRIAEALAERSNRIDWTLAESMRCRMAAESAAQWIRGLALEVSGGTVTSPDELRQAADEIDAIVRELGEAAIGPQAAVSQLVDSLRTAADRARRVKEIQDAGKAQRTPGLQVVRDIAKPFLGADPENPQPVSAFGSPDPVHFDFAPLLSLQAGDACAALGGIAVRVVDDATGTAAAGTAEARGVVRLMGQFTGNRCASSSALELVLNACDAIDLAKPQGEIQAALQAMLKDGDNTKNLMRVMARAGRSPKVATVAPNAMQALVALKGVAAEVQKSAATELINAITGWDPFDASQAASLLQSAGTVGFDSSRFVRERVLKCLEGTSAGRMQPFTEAARWHLVAANLSNGDLSKPLYGDWIVTLKAEMKEQPESGQAELALIGLQQALSESGADASSYAKLQSVMEAVRAHRKKVSELKLLPVMSASGVRCYLGKNELDAGDVKALPHDRLSRALASDRTLPFDFTGQPSGTNAIEISEGLTSSLGVTKQNARVLADAFGCRLPVDAEWNDVRARGLVPGSPAYNAVLKRRNDPVVAGIRHCDWLQARGDEIASRAGGASWVGMLVGVREWCSDLNDPVGCSLDCGCGFPEAKPGAVDDVGLRLALDAVPQELEDFN